MCAEASNETVDELASSLYFGYASFRRIRVVSTRDQAFPWCFAWLPSVWDSASFVFANEDTHSCKSAVDCAHTCLCEYARKRYYTIDDRSNVLHRARTFLAMARKKGVRAILTRFGIRKKFSHTVAILAKAQAQCFRWTTILERCFLMQRLTARVLMQRLTAPDAALDRTFLRDSRRSGKYEHCVRCKPNASRSFGKRPLSIFSGKRTLETLNQIHRPDTYGPLCFNITSIGRMQPSP